MNIIEELAKNPWTVTIVGGIVVLIILGIYRRILAIRRLGKFQKGRSIEKDTRRSPKAKRDVAEKIRWHQVIEEMEQKLIRTQQKLKAEEKKQESLHAFYRLVALDQMKRDIILSEMISRKSGEFNNFLKRVFEITEKKQEKMHII